MLGSATFTIETSRITMNCARQHRTSVNVLARAATASEGEAEAEVTPVYCCKRNYRGRAALSARRWRGQAGRSDAAGPDDRTRPGPTVTRTLRARHRRPTGRLLRA